MRARVLPFEVFGLIHAAVILSLFYAPAPWLTGAGGYSADSLLVSITGGIALAAAAVIGAITRLIRMQTYLWVSGALAGLLLVYSILSMGGEPIPRAIFSVCAVLLIGSNLTLKTPVHVKGLRFYPREQTPPPSDSRKNQEPPSRAA